MGCLSALKLWRKSPTAADVNQRDASQAPSYQNSIVSDNSRASDFEKPLLPAVGRGAGAPPTREAILSIRPTAHHSYSAYSGPANPSRQQPNWSPYRSDRPAASPKWTESLASTKASEPTWAEPKTDGIDESDEKAQQRRADEARRKAEREEQERLDFFQMM
ncbi:hypothetical protein B0T26DRAFT_752499 [Lasiosphaeria miniovina]|uniref:Uncharacterized protein n=1 Tax=Lasiosphaeria miniovina TaxID=1954250 RepID=A0AA40AMI1_9PEZI|nr:uncharacterized protein B0T26DRAFT_752499 [Lasiosphaeria miniovina]KAK0718591.1 hypothetical protein B0T26DRAFT_752499 [Lasiosphaeria miniovina]